MEYMNDYDPKMIGKRIKETAQSKGYTAEKLSEITGNGIHTINRIYQGTSISTEYICQLSQVLGVSTDYSSLYISPFGSNPRIIRSADIFSNQRIFRKTGKAFLSQQNFCTGAFFYLVQDL